MLPFLINPVYNVKHKRNKQNTTVPRILLHYFGYKTRLLISNFLGFFPLESNCCSLPMDCATAIILVSIMIPNILKESDSIFLS